MGVAAERVRDLLADYDKTVSDPTQAEDIAEVDLICDLEDLARAFKADPTCTRYKS